MGWRILQHEITSDTSILRFSASARVASAAVRECLNGMDRELSEIDTVTWVIRPPLADNEIAALHKTCSENSTPITIQSAQNLQEAA